MIKPIEFTEFGNIPANGFVLSDLCSKSVFPKFHSHLEFLSSIGLTLTNGLSSLWERGIQMAMSTANLVPVGPPSYRQLFLLLESNGIEAALLNAQNIGSSPRHAGPLVLGDNILGNLMYSIGIFWLVGFAILGYCLYRIWTKARDERNRSLRKQMAMEFQISLTEKYIEKERLKQKELQQELEFKDKQITSYAFSFEQKNMTLDELQQIVKAIERATSAPEKLSLVKKLKDTVKKSLIADKNWECFRSFFQETQYGFHAKLLSKHEHLKPNDLKLCSVIRLNLSIKETAQVLGISSGSLKTARYRLRKKLNLAPNQEIIDYLISLENEEPVAVEEYIVHDD